MKIKKIINHLINIIKENKHNYQNFNVNFKKQKELYLKDRD